MILKRTSIALTRVLKPGCDAVQEPLQRVVRHHDSVLAERECYVRPARDDAIKALNIARQV